MSTLRGMRSPGDLSITLREPGEEGEFVILGILGQGDRIYPPKELGGGEQRIEAIVVAPCLCEQWHNVRHFYLTGVNKLAFAECATSSQFYWYSRKLHEAPTVDMEIQP